MVEDAQAAYAGCFASGGLSQIVWNVDNLVPHWVEIPLGYRVG